MSAAIFTFCCGPSLKNLLLILCFHIFISFLICLKLLSVDLTDFWLIAVFVICLISSCIGCCVRASRRRRAEQYMRINHTIPAGYGTTRVTVTPVAYPNGMANPPQYGNAGKVEHAAPPAYHAPPQYAQ